MLLENQVALVTGAAQGLGRGIALALVEEGARVAATDIFEAGARETAQALESQGGRTLALTLDVTSEASIDAALETVVRDFGRLDLLVNNAGVIALNPLLEINAADSARTLEVNVQGVLRCSQRAAQQMIRQGEGGVIVNIASNAGKVGFPDMADYNASKAAVISLTRSMAAELAPRIGEAADALLASFPPKQLGRLIEPIEVGRVVAFLSSDRARIIRGQAINVDAGETPY